MRNAMSKALILRYPAWKLTYPLKNSGSKASLSFWGPAYFQGLCQLQGVYMFLFVKPDSTVVKVDG